jgi:hypothetical protein
LRPSAALLAVSLAATGVLACSGTGTPTQARPIQPIAPAPPPKDDGNPSQGGNGGEQHAAALEELRGAKVGWRNDRQNSVKIQLPDADHWTRVKFWGVKSLVGFRYGKEHHAIVAGFVMHMDDESQGACGKAFEQWAQPYVDSFEVQIEHDPPKAVPWNGKILDIDSLVATTATLGMRDEYAAAYATYPAWPGACLVMGVAVPARDELERAKAVRDRFASEILPTVTVSKDEPKESY